MFEQNTIYNPNGSALVVFDGESLDFNGIPTHEEEMMKSDFVAVSWNDTRKYTLPVGAYVVLDGVKYMLLDPYTPEQKNEESFTYSPQFQHPVMWLTKIPFIHVSGDTSSWETATKDTDWTYTGSASTIAARLVECINWLSTVDPAIGEVFDDGWTAVVSDDLAASATCNFSSLSIFGAASEMANKFDCEFHFDYAEKTFRFGTVSYGDSVTFKVGDNVQVASVSNTKEDYYNAFLVHGSTRNLSQPTESGNMQVFRRLDLDPTTYPDSILYTDNSGNVITRDYYLTKEKVPLDEDGNRTEDEVNGKLDPADGKKYKYYSKWYIRLASPVKNELGEITGWEDYLVQDDQIISGETLSLVFQANEESHTYTSPLAGREFELVFFKQETREKEQDDINPDGFTAQPGDYRIVFTEEGELIIPTTSPMGLVPKGAATPSAENNIISLFNIAIGDDEMRVARERLLTAATREKNRLRSDLNNYTFKSNPVAFEQNPPTLHLGQTAVYNDGQDLNGGTAYSYQSHIIKLVTNLDFPCEVEITVGNEKVKGTMTTMKEQIETIITAGGGEGGGYTESQFSNLVKRFGSKFFLSKVVADFAQGVITFVKGLFVGDGTHGIDENGNATLNDTTLNSVQTPSYSGTDIVSDKGFKVWEDNEGKSHMMVDYFSARIKAFFASLEIRKIEHSAGNRIESPAGNTLALVKKFDASGQEVRNLWYARRYTFAGVSFGMPKLVYQVANYFGVWKEDPSATVAFYRCYWTAEDKEDKKAVENNWKVGDQAFCQTFNLRTHDKDGHTMSGYASNKRYWRIVEATGYDIIEGTEYAYIDLSNRPLITLTVDGITKNCKGYETSEGQNLNDAPEAGDDVACLGNQIIPEERGGALQYITYDPNASDPQSLGVPCVKMYSGIGGNVDYPYDLERYVIQKQSPRGVFVRADKFEILSASGTGSSTLTCERGAWDSTQTYGHNDIVQHHGSTWLCVVAVGTTTQVEPSESVPTIWQVYARRGASTPQLEVDSANAVVSANYEGKITNISAATGLPGNFELWIDGNIIPTADWNLAQSHVQFGDVTLPLNNTIHYMGFGIVVDEIAVNDTDVDIAWEYRPMTEQEIGGRIVYTHPIINPFNIVLHVVFDYHGDTLVADTTIPMIVQKAAASVRAQYSADNSSWHSDLRTTDLYIRYSYDDGNTWTQGTRFVGKSIEFEKGIRHFASYDDLMAYLVSIESAMTDKDMGYYIADTDDGGTPEATLWYFYTQSSDPRDIQQVPLPQSGEVNYLTSYDGHLWNADNTSEYWADMGMIQGADGEDGVSVTLDPATVIFEQDENNTSLIKGLPFTSTVRVWKGATILSPSAYSVSVDATKQDNHCNFSVSGNIVTISGLNTDATTHAPYTSGKVVITVTYNGTSIDLVINWAANLLGTWKASVVNDAYTSVSSKPIAIINSNGEIETKTFETIFQQTAEYIMLDVDGFAGKTGIDLEDGTITLKANKVAFTNSSGTVSDKISIDPTTGTLHAADGIFEGTLNAKSYQTQFADLETYCYSDRGARPADLFCAPGFNDKMYDANGNELDIEGIWCFRVGAVGMEIWLPTNINNVGQRVVIYNPYIGYLQASHATKICAGEIETDGITGGKEAIRGVGIPVRTADPVLINQYDPVYEILFCDGIVELQCMPSSTAGHYEWCVVNLGTNVIELSGDNN